MSEPWTHYDINLLRTFLTVYETRSVTMAAERLFVSQPSVSYNLSKLRRLFSDPLFLRRQGTLEPTARADALYPEISHGIRVLDSLVRNARQFEPKETTRTFKLMMTDLGLMALFSYIVQAMQERAPEARIQVSLIDVAKAEELLRRGEADAAIAIPEFSPDLVARDHLMDMPYVGVCSSYHPRLTDSPSVEDLIGEQRIHVSNTLGHQKVEETLVRIGLDALPTIALPTYSVVDETLMATECFCIVPLFLGDMFAKRSSIKKFRVPFHLEPGHVGLHTLRQLAPSPAINWLREVIIESLEAYPYPKYVPAQA